MTDRAGFADPVHDSQTCFRAVLDALAQPGTIHQVQAPAAPPPPLGRAAAAVLLTLVDGDTPLWLDPACAAAAAWIGFHCGAPAAALEQACFVLARDAVAFDRVAAGSDEGPEDGATVILVIEALGAGGGFVLEGPGLAAATPFRATLPPGFVATWAANQARFPRGFDLVLCAGNGIAAFPRTLTIREG